MATTIRCFLLHHVGCQTMCGLNNVRLPSGKISRITHFVEALNCSADGEATQLECIMNP